MVTCRVCDNPVDDRIFEEHLNMCSLKAKHEIRAIECDGYFKKLHKKLTILIEKLNKIYSKKKKSKLGDYIDFIGQLIGYCEESMQFGVNSVEKLTALLLKVEKNFPEKKVLKLSSYSSPLLKQNKEKEKSKEETKEEEELSNINCIEYLQELVTLLQIKKKLWKSIYISSSLIRNKGLLIHNNNNNNNYRNQLNNSTQSIPSPHSPTIDRFTITTNIPKISDFEILKPITKGGFARVYLAKKKSTSDLFAIKVLKKKDMVEKNQVDRVFIEKNILADVSCPYVVRLYYALQTKVLFCSFLFFFIIYYFIIIIIGVIYELF